MVKRLVLTLINLLFLVPCYAQVGPGGITPRSIQSVTDGTNTCYPYQIKVGSNSCSGGVATITTGGSSGAGNVGIGTINYVPEYIGVSTLGPSNIIDVAGNVSIGTTASFGILTIGHAPYVYIDNSSNLNVGGYLTTGGNITMNGGGILNLQNNGSNTIEMGSSPTEYIQDTAASGGDLKIGTNSLERVRITNDGNVGIGNPSPTQLLTVGNSMTVDASGNQSLSGQLLVNQSGTANPAVNVSDNFGNSALYVDNTNGFGQTYIGQSADDLTESLLEMTITQETNNFVSMNGASVNAIFSDPGDQTLHIGNYTGNPFGLTIDTPGIGSNSGFSQALTITQPGALGCTGNCYAGFEIYEPDDSAIMFNFSTLGFGYSSNIGIFVPGDTLMIAGQTGYAAGSGSLGAIANGSFGVVTGGFGNNPRLLIDPSGNVGIGTWLPKDNLEVTTSSGVDLLQVNSTKISTIHNILDWSGGIASFSSNVGIGTNGTDAALEVEGGNVGIGTFRNSAKLAVMGGNVGIGTWLPSNLFEVGTRALDVQSGGNVGIGSITPGQKLDVQGAVRATALSIFGGTSSQFLKANGTTDSTAYGSGTVTSIIAGTGLGGGTITTSGTITSNAVYQMSFQPGLITSITNTKSVFGKVSKASTVDNIEGSANSFSCVSNPTITMYECGTSTTCSSSPITIGSVTVTSAGTAFDGTVSSSAITAGDYVAFAITAGTCAGGLDISVTSQVHSN